MQIDAAVCCALQPKGDRSLLAALGPIVTMPVATLLPIARLRPVAPGHLVPRTLDDRCDSHSCSCLLLLLAPISHTFFRQATHQRGNAPFRLSRRLNPHQPAPQPDEMIFSRKRSILMCVSTCNANVRTPNRSGCHLTRRQDAGGHGPAYEHGILPERSDAAYRELLPPERLLGERADAVLAQARHPRREAHHVA